MAFWVAHNKTIPYEILEVLARSRESRVRAMVAMKGKLKEALLLKMASDPDDSVRMLIARHKNATRKVLEKLQKDEWSEISNLVKERLQFQDFK
jgi:hypothetical protein